jgi:DNA ligase (NAD+)
MIIPQIAENLDRSDTVEIPSACPACGGATEISNLNGVQSLYCTNDACPVKMIKAITLLVSRDALNIEGMSEATLEKFIGKGFIQTYADLFHLERHREEIVALEGFGEKSYANIQKSLEAARQTTLPRLIYGLGIANIGVANARLLCREFAFDIEKLRHASVEEFAMVEGIGGVIAASLYDYFHDEKNNSWLDMLLAELAFAAEVIDSSTQNLQGLSFAITGSLNHYPSRKELQEEIERRGGKVTSSVTSKTTALINNDNTSSSTKNKSARDLKIPILTEEEFAEKYL